LAAVIEQPDSFTGNVHRPGGDVLWTVAPLVDPPDPARIEIEHNRIRTRFTHGGWCQKDQEENREMSHVLFLENPVVAGIAGEIR
jgi:hypothetical protein